jgi:hypothetical protein
VALYEFYFAISWRLASSELFFAVMNHCVWCSFPQSIKFVPSAGFGNFFEGGGGADNPAWPFVPRNFLVPVTNLIPRAKFSSVQTDS